MPNTQVVAENLSVVKGIGPALANKLADWADSLEQVAGLTPDSLRDQLPFPLRKDTAGNLIEYAKERLADTNEGQTRLVQIAVDNRTTVRKRIPVEEFKRLQGTSPGVVAPIEDECNCG